jgi:hypothetical protein
MMNSAVIGLKGAESLNMSDFRSYFFPLSDICHPNLRIFLPMSLLIYMDVDRDIGHGHEH